MGHRVERRLLSDADIAIDSKTENDWAQVMRNNGKALATDAESDVHLRLRERAAAS